MESCEHCNALSQIDYHEIIECITCALDAKDPYTAGHSQRVSDMALRVSTLMGFKQSDIEAIHIAAHLHDIGKIGIPDAILNKTERLTDGEWAEKKNIQLQGRIFSVNHHISMN